MNRLYDISLIISKLIEILNYNYIRNNHHSGGYTIVIAHLKKTLKFQNYG